MTRLFVDAREIPFPPGGMCSLDQVLKHVELTEMPPNFVIRQVQVDGAPYLHDNGFHDGQTELDTRETIEVFTASLEEIARDSIAEAVSYLERVESVIPSLSSSFQVFPGPEAFENLRQLCDGFYWLNLLLDRLGKTFHLNSEDQVVQGLSICDQNQRLLTILRQLVEAQERQDFTLISDLLEYEIQPFIPVWKDMFGAMGKDSVTPS
jgi:hypothetical protein